MYAKCFYTDVLTWMMKSHAMDDSEIYDDDDDDEVVYLYMYYVIVQSVQ